MPKKAKINTWTKFWRLVIIRETLSRVTPWWTTKRYFECKCECWVIKEYMMTHLKSWKVISCWCFRSEKMKWMIWKKHYQWKWWQNLKSQIRWSNQYKDWRTSCYERDNYTCQISGQKWWDLVVHHLNPFHIIVDDLDDNFRDSEILWDLDNGITLTKELHNIFHRKYWNKNFTKEDFNKFSKN